MFRRNSNQHKRDVWCLGLTHLVSNQLYLEMALTSWDGFSLSAKELNALKT